MPDELLSSYKSKWSQLGADKFYGLSIVKNNGMAISGTTLVQYFGTNESVTIPSNVTTILPYAFYGNAFVRSVVIPGSVETVSTYAFAGCSALETVRMNTGVRKVDASAFAGCEKLTTIIFPATLTSIGSNAFDGCTNITSLTLPSKLDTIGESAFKNVQITTIVVPKSVTSIGAGAFQGCPLENITLPFVGGSRATSDSVESTSSPSTYSGSPYLFGYIFGAETKNTGSLNAPNSTDGLIYQGQGKSWSSYYSYWTRYYIPATLKSVTITDATGISANAFYGCTMIESLTLNDGITAIYDKAFYNCTALKSMSLPSSITELGNYAFYGCGDMANITLPNLTKISYGAFQGCSSLDGVVLPETLTEIGDYAFSGCVGLTGITIPNTVTRIGQSAFSGCTGITELTLPNGLQTIGQEAFKNVQITTIVVPKSVTSIGVGAFQGCPLKSITLPFVGGNRATSGRVEGTSSSSTYSGSPYLFGYIFGAETKNTGSLNAPNSTDGLIYQGQGKSWSSYYSYWTRYYIPATLKSVTITDATGISANAFYGCTMIESLTLNEGITVIYDKAFYDCSSLKSMKVPTTVETIGSYAWYNCSEMANIQLPNVTELSDYLLFGCSKLTEVVIPDSVTIIGAYAFDGCTGITVLIIPNQVQTIGSDEFSGCTGIKTVRLSVNLKSIGNNAFYGCTGITALTLPSKLETIGGGAFQGTRLKNIIIPQGVTIINSDTFFNCNCLESIVISSTIQSIGSQAFYNCMKLKIVIIENGNVMSLTALNSTNVFDGCNTSLCIIVPKDAYQAYKSASNWSRYASKIYSDENVVEGKFLVVDGVLKQYLGTDAEVTIPDSVTSIGDYAFAYNTTVKKITWNGQLKQIGNYAFADCVALTTINSSAAETFDLGTGLTTIGQYAFSNCTGAKTIVVREGVTSIGYAAFMGCANLSEITLPFVGMDNTASYNQNQVFGYIFGYTTTAGDDRVMQYNGYYYYIPKTLKSVTNTSETVIGKNAFINCDMLESITIQGDVESIGDYAFYSCSNLKSITVLTTTVPTLSSYALNSDSTAVIYVKADMVEQFKSATGWKDFTIQTVQ